MSLLREVPFIKTSVIRTYDQASQGHVLLASSSGTSYVSSAIGVTNSRVEVTSTKGIYISEAVEVESAGVPVEGGGLLYVTDGKLKYRGTNGTITTVADA